METGFYKKNIYGHSFSKMPVEFYEAGQGRAILFLGSFSPDPTLEDVFSLFMEEIAESAGEKCGALSFPVLLFNRRLIFLPFPNPDARLIKSPDFTPAHPLYDRVCRIAKGEAPDRWQANCRGVDPAVNFNCAFSSYKKKCPSGPAPAGFCGEFPESEPESGAIARLLRFLDAVLLVRFDKGEGLSLAAGEKHPQLSRLCASHSFLPPASFDFSCSPEGWALEERAVPSLHIGIPEECLTSSSPARLYGLLRPLLFALLAF